MLLNVGSGDHAAPPPWVSIDARVIPTAQVCAEALHMPFRDGAAQALYCGHCIEHVPLDALAAFLAELRRVLEPGGSLMLVIPDIERCVRTSQPQWLLETVIAHGDPPSGHAWTATEPVLLWLLRTHGWTATPIPIAEVIEPHWPNSAVADWQSAVLCR